MKHQNLSLAVLLAAGMAVALPGKYLLGSTAAAQTPRALPTFEMEKDWPKVPPQWKVGDVSSFTTDAQGNVWLIHRPRTLKGEDLKKAAPPVMVFDVNGNFIKAWGGEGQGYEWPQREHGIYIDYKGFVWLGGNNCPGNNLENLKPVADDQLLKFTQDGKFVMQIGHSNQSKGNADTANLHRPADEQVYSPTNELFVAVGYEQLVGRRIDLLVGRTMKVRRVGIAFALVAVANLHDELAVLGELQQLVIGHRLETLEVVAGAIVAAEPHEALIVDIDAMLALGPFIALALAAPSLDEIAVNVEHHHGRRRLLEVLALERARPVDEPDIDLRVRGEARHIADLPLRRHLGPILLHFEGRQGARRLGSGSGAEQVLTRQGHRHAGRKQDRKTQILMFHGLSSVGLQLEIAWELFLEWPRRRPRRLPPRPVFDVPRSGPRPRLPRGQRSLGSRRHFVSRQLSRGSSNCTVGRYSGAYEDLYRPIR